jgi:hypothetical protein
MNQRELLNDLTGALNWASVDNLADTPDFELAEKIIDAPHLAGYCKRRTVTTTGELDALPIWSVVRDGEGWVWEACSRTWAGENPRLNWDGPDWGDRSEDIALPATVLYEPAEPVSEP